MTEGLTIWWVRHGPTHRKTMVGWTDAPADLSDTPALARLSAYLPEDAPIVSSDLSRASATADAIGRGRPRLPHRPALREMNFGGWEDRALAEIEAETPGRLAAFYERPGEVRPPCGESWTDLAARVDADVAQLVATRQGALIAVAHFGVILSQLERALRRPAPDIFAQPVANLSITRIDYRAGTASAGEINHLA